MDGARCTGPHPRPARVGSLLLAVVTVGVVGAGSVRAAAGNDPRDGVNTEALARQVEAQLIAPCCFAQTVDNHASAVTAEIKLDIRRRLRTGEASAAIVEAYRERYGDRILAAPPARGFNVLAYVVPPLFLVAGLAAAGCWLRRRLRRPGACEAPPPVRVDPRLRARLESELAHVEP